MNYHQINMFIFMAASVLLFAAAVLSPHDEGVMDIFFFGLSLVSGTVSVNLFKKNREEKRLGLF